MKSYSFVPSKEEKEGMIDSCLEFMQADIVIETGFISALPAHKEAIDELAK